MEGILRHLESGRLMYIRCDGCALGYRDRESGYPCKKPMGIATSMISAVSILGTLRCCGCSYHEQLQGNNKFGLRTAQAAEWPEEFDKLVTDVIAQQVLIDEAEDSIEAFPLGVEEPRPIPPRLAQVWRRVRIRRRRRRTRRQCRFLPRTCRGTPRNAAVAAERCGRRSCR